jgi:hypothetical protein
VNEGEVDLHMISTHRFNAEREASERKPLADL